MLREAAFLRGVAIGAGVAIVEVAIVEVAFVEVVFVEVAFVVEG
jgi:hypothetical protein